MESDDRARVPAEPAGLRAGGVWWLVCGAALLALCGLWLLPAATVRANTRTVTNCAYGGTGSLFNQIAAANPGDTIVFTAGLNCTSAGAGAGPIVGIGYTISQDLTIDGSGASIVVDGSCTWPGASGPCLNDGNGRTNFFINGGTVVLKGLTIQHGYGAAGGGIDNSATLTVTNCTITQNSAGGIAGNGIYNSGTLSVTNSTLSYNTSALFNGANSGGGSYNSGTLSVTHSTFDHNVTSGGTDGGGINNDGGAATVTNGTFSANNAGGNGGGIENNGGMLGVTNSTFSGNDAGTYGGGIHNSGTATVTNSTFSGPVLAFYGGGIANTGSGTLAVTNGTFSPT